MTDAIFPTGAALQGVSVTRGRGLGETSRVRPYRSRLWPVGARAASGPPATGEADDLLIDQIAFLFVPRCANLGERRRRLDSTAPVARARPHSPHSHRIQERSFGRLGPLVIAY
jgi:hypothetical protein